MGRIRHAAAHDLAALDEHDVGAGRGRAAQQVGGEHRAGESGTHNYEGFSHTWEILPSEDG